MRLPMDVQKLTGTKYDIDNLADVGTLSTPSRKPGRDGDNG